MRLFNPVCQPRCKTMMEALIRLDPIMDADETKRRDIHGHIEARLGLTAHADLQHLHNFKLFVKRNEAKALGDTLAELEKMRPLLFADLFEAIRECADVYL